MSADHNLCIATACSTCTRKPECTRAKQRFVSRHFDEVAFEAAKARCLAHPEMMKRHRAIAEQPFGNLKARIFGNRRLLVRGLRGVRGEMALAVLAHNVKRMAHMPGIPVLMRKLAQT